MGILRCGYARYKKKNSRVWNSVSELNTSLIPRPSFKKGLVSTVYISLIFLSIWCTRVALYWCSSMLYSYSKHELHWWSSWECGDWNWFAGLLLSNYSRGQNKVYVLFLYYGRSTVRTVFKKTVWNFYYGSVVRIVCTVSGRAKHLHVYNSCIACQILFIS